MQGEAASSKSGGAGASSGSRQVLGPATTVPFTAVLPGPERTNTNALLSRDRPTRRGPPPPSPPSAAPSDCGTVGFPGVQPLTIAQVLALCGGQVSVSPLRSTGRLDPIK
jgi:hypothetical protein